MKKLIYILAGIILLTSCKKDFLDRQPLDEYSESSLWSNAKDAQTALNGCYSGWEDADRIVYMDCASDNAYNCGILVLFSVATGFWQMWM